MSQCTSSPPCWLPIIEVCFLFIGWWPMFVILHSPPTRITCSYTSPVQSRRWGAYGFSPSFQTVLPGSGTLASSVATRTLLGQALTLESLATMTRWAFSHTTRLPWRDGMYWISPSPSTQTRVHTGLYGTEMIISRSMGSCLGLTITGVCSIAMCLLICLNS
jgi:hypothetical protein